MKRFISAILLVAFFITPMTVFAEEALDVPDPDELFTDVKVADEIEHYLHPATADELFALEKARAGELYLLQEDERLEEAPYIPRRWTEDCVVVISRMVWGEGRGVSRNEQKLIVWTVINRLENGRYGSSLIGVVRARGQFHGYSSRFPVTEEIREMVIEVLEAWDRGEAAKVYPPFAQTPYYLYFHGDGRHNWFRERHR